MRSASISALLWRVFGLALLLALGGGRLWAQTTVYTWTDENGVTHFSNSMVPAQHSRAAEKMVLPPRPSLTVGRAGVFQDIPLVLLNNDSSQKFVNATLRGNGTTRDVLMLVDTGAQITLIDEALAEELDLEHEQDAVLTGVTGSAAGWIGRLPTLELGTERVNDLSVMVGPTPGYLLLGMDVLEHLQLAVGPRSLQRTR